MKTILYIVDNKYRDLWGIYNLTKNLLKQNLNLKICNKFNWHLAIKTYDPLTIITPNARRGIKAFQKIIDYCKRNKIKIIIYPSEGLEYTNDMLNYEFPNSTLKNVDKFFLWAKDHGKIHRKKGYEKKARISGNLRFNDKLNFLNKKKIKTIGITTTTRYTTSSISDINIPRLIHSRQGNRRYVSFIKTELEFFDVVSNILNYFSKFNIRFVFKPHPFENPQFYKDAYPNIEIETDPDIRVFLSKIDLLLNQESSTNVHALKYKVPVINIENLLRLEPEYKKIYREYLPSKIGVKVKNFNELKLLILKKTKKQIYNLNVSKGDLKLISKIAPTLNTIDIMTNEINLMTSKKNSVINFFCYFKYFLKEVFLLLANKRTTLYRPFSVKDKTLLKKFSIKE